MRTSNPFGQFAEGLIHIAVTNRPPALGILPDTMVAAGETLVWNLLPFATDPDDAVEDLQCSLDDMLPAQATIDAAQLHLPAPDGVPAYVETLVVRATDSSGSSAADTLQIFVTNLPPTLALLPDTTLAKGDSLSWNLAPFAADPDDDIANLQWSISGTQQVRASIDDAGLLQLRTPVDTPAYLETIGVQITAPSGLFAAETLQISITNLPPTLEDLPDTSVAKNALLTLDLASFAVDPDDAVENLQWSIDGIQQTQVSIDGTLLRFQASPQAAAHIKDLQLCATDSSGLFATSNFQISIFNLPPSFQNLPAVVLDLGSTASIQLDLYTSDGPLEQLTWKLLPDTGLLIDFESFFRTAILSAQGNWHGQTQIAVEVTDVEGLRNYLKTSLVMLLLCQKINRPLAKE